MSDLLTRLNRNPATSALVKALGLPNPALLAREQGPYAERPLDGKRALLVRSAGGFAADALQAALASAGATVIDAMPDDLAPAAVVAMDATGCRTPADFGLLYEAFHPVMRRIAKNGRVLLLAADPAAAAGPVDAAVARGVEGFVRSLAKELGGKGSVANLAYIDPAATSRLDGPVRFFCGPQSTYVTGQVFHLTPQVAAPAALPFAKALAGKVALVTGAARGIGRATAERLAQEGAQVVGLDVRGIL